MMVFGKRHTVLCRIRQNGERALPFPIIGLSAKRFSERKICHFENREKWEMFEGKGLNAKFELHTLHVK